MKLVLKAAAAAVILLAPTVHADTYPWVSKYKKQNRIFIHYTEQSTLPGPSGFRDNNYANMRALGFTQNDIDTLESECKAYFVEYYGIDFNNLTPLPDASYVLPDGSATMFPERLPEGTDQRVVMDTANRGRDNDPKKSYTAQDTGCAVAILKPGVYGGIHQGETRAVGDLIIYGYVNIFDPKKPIHKNYLIERIKYKPAWTIKSTPVQNDHGLPLFEAVFKVESEYTDKQGVVHHGVGISGFSQRFDKDGNFAQSKRTTYTFPE